MPFDRLRFAAIVSLVCLTAGCASAGGLKLAKADNWGEAYRQTLAAQIINPAPEYNEPLAASSGDHAAKAIERYRTDRVKQPVQHNLSNAGRQSGGAASPQTTGGN